MFCCVSLSLSLSHVVHPQCTKDDFSLDDVVLHLSKNPKDITGVDEYGQTLLHQLCGYGGSVPTLVVKEVR